MKKKSQKNICERILQVIYLWKRLIMRNWGQCRFSMVGRAIGKRQYLVIIRDNFC